MFTAKVQYALILLQDLYSAEVNGNICPVKLVDIANKHGLKQEFLGKVATQLKKAKMIQATKGPGGGFVLGINSPNNLKDIIQCVQPESELKHASEGKQAQDYIEDLYNEYLLLMEELEV